MTDEQIRRLRYIARLDQLEGRATHLRRDFLDAVARLGLDPDHLDFRGLEPEVLTELSTKLDAYELAFKELRAHEEGNHG